MNNLSGAGISLRSNFFADLMASKQPINWLEIVADQFIGTKGYLLERLLSITSQYPSNLHCVSFSIAGVDQIDNNYLQQIKILAEQINAQYVSDHLCWSTFNGKYSHDLLPFPYNKAYLDYIAGRIDYIQEKLGRPLLLENLSHYLQTSGDLSEAEFLNELCSRTGSGILLDINNLYVSSQNLNYNAKEFIETINSSYIKQCHLAGHTGNEHRLIDTHSAKVIDEVWCLYKFTLDKIGAIPTCLEWDSDIPEWNIILTETQKIKTILEQQTINIESTIVKLKNPNQNNNTPPPTSLTDFQKEIWQQVSSNIDIDEANPLAVHQNSMRIQRINALMHVYPCIVKCLGEKKFTALAIAYVLCTQSTSANISENMHDFCDFLFAQLEEKYISALAQYEWLWYSVFHNINNTTVDIKTLDEKISSKGADMILQHCQGLKLLAINYPVLELWQAFQEEYDGPDVKLIISNMPNNKIYYYTLQQRQGHVIAIELTKNAFKYLKALESPLSIKKWCDIFAKENNFEPALAAEFFQSGLIDIV
jgi:uncharacterized protein (UPF0276 family)